MIAERLFSREFDCVGSVFRNNSKVMKAVNAGHLLSLMSSDTTTEG